MKKMQKGFTLIELMIVIAIIGILASIAFPVYQDYIARTQAMEGFKATAGIQTDIGVIYADKGKLPNGTDEPLKSSLAELGGKYFDKNTVTVTSGVITITFNSKGANSGETMTLTPSENSANGQIQKWTCGGSIDKSRLPSSCQ